MIFLDTSVLVAIAQVDHVHHVPSRELWNGCQARRNCRQRPHIGGVLQFCHIDATRDSLSGRDAMLALDTFLRRTTPIALTSDEYIETLRICATAGLAGGAIYDALHVACARKVNAEWIYTWNMRHFHRVAPDLAGRILEP